MNVANVCTWLVTCNDLGNDPTYVETPPPRSENVQRICRIMLEKPLTFKLLIHLLVLTHTESTFCCLKENGKILQSFDKTQLCKQQNCKSAVAADTGRSIGRFSLEESGW